MYYLLEDNRIIDMNNICSQKEFIEENGKLKELTGFNLSSIGLQKFYNDVYVKKQSENVYDLIEKGDLVNTIVDSIYQVVIIEKNTIIAPQCAFDLAVVTAIYKPDSQGNYIKVWEEKKDE